MFGDSIVSRRLMLIIVVTFIGMTTISGVGLNNLKDNLIRDRQMEAKAIVDSAVSIINHYYQRAQKGEFQEAEVKKRAIEAIGQLRYDNTNYVFIVDDAGTSVAHPWWKGQNHIDDLDVNGLPFVRLLIKGAQQGGAYINYMWRRDSQNTPVPKIAYVEPFKPWGWTIGTGIYVDDVDRIFADNVAIVGGFSLLLFFVVCGGAAMIVRAIDA